MKIRYYNRQPWAPQGVDPNILETGLGNDLERKAKYAIDRLIDDPASLDEDDIVTLLTYLEFQRIRVPRQAETAKGLMRETILRLVQPLAWISTDQSSPNALTGAVARPLTCAVVV